MSRRELVRDSLLASGALLVGFERLFSRQAATPKSPLGAPAQPFGRRQVDTIEEPFRRGRQVGVVPFTQEAPVPMGKAFGAELDRRLYTDLSALTPQNLITPAQDFYIRTGASELISNADLSSIKLGGLVRQPLELSVADIAKQIKPMGLHLMECAGNARAVHFGMMSVAHWSGVPLAPIVESAVDSRANRVLVSGFDRYATQSQTSVPGASWIFTLNELKSAGAFLATEMNAQPLPQDHGAPVRLVVPGWYGCTCIKWANEITIVDDDAPATSQMQEYASRTLQEGVPQLARDYQPAIIEPAAMPVRIEKWIVDGKIIYRIVGILWGSNANSAPVKGLEIRFNPDEDFAPIRPFERSTTGSWSLWTHPWRPRKTDTYMIRLRIQGDGPTRKMDTGYYLRSVDITEI